MSVVVFDLDGTLTDTEADWDVVRRGLAAEDGRPWPEGATQAMMGMSTQEWAAYLHGTVGLLGSADDAARRTIDAMVAVYHRGLTVLPGAVEAVRRMHAHWTVGLASSSPRVLIDAAVAELGLADVFSTTVSTEELNGVGKPAPDVYLEVCRRLGADPTRSVAVEDAPNGIRSARAAGMIVIAIPPHFHPPTPDVLALADAVIDDLAALDEALVGGLISARNP